MPEKRERWASRPAFIMAAIGSAIGLGNVWRFPGVAFNNGGGAFFVPYFIALMTAGIPLMIVEYGLGSRFQGSAPKSYRQLRPGFETIGWWAVLIGLGISFYYCVILAWSWEYCWQCVQGIFTGELPWEPGRAQEYFHGDVLELSEDAVTPGGFQWGVLIGLALTWLSIYLSVVKGVLRVGKIVMITVPLPLILLVILALRGLTLPGAMDGLAYYLAPDWSKLLVTDTWIAAYGQIFFSLSVGWGILIAYASYMPKKTDVVNNAFITSYANCGFSFLAGFAVFSTMGYLGVALNTPIGDLKATSFGLAFTSYPTAIENLPGTVSFQALMGVLFFLMLLTLGVDSAFSIIEAVSTAMYDKFRMKRGTLTLLLCVAGFFVGLVYCFGSGLYWLDITDKFLSDYSLPTVAFVQCLLVGWFIGPRKLRDLQDEINARSELKAGFIWRWSLRLVTPGVLAVILVQQYRKLFEEGYGDYPAMALYFAGVVPALIAILAAVLLRNMKGKGDVED